MRAWLYDRLTTDVTLQGLVGVGVSRPTGQWLFPRESLTSANIPFPYVAYGLGNDTNEELAEASDHVAHRQFLQIWVFDEGADYLKIDAVLDRVKVLLHNAQSPPDMVTRVGWLERSQDFAQQTLNAIFRYDRYQAIISKGSAP